MGVVHIFLVVGVNPLLLFVGGLCRLLHFVVLGHRSELPLHFAVIQDLVSSYLLELHSVELVLLLLLLPHHLSLSHLHFALKVDLVDLILVQALEVVWLHTMWGEHAHLGLRIFSHEIMVIGKLQFVFLELGPRLMHLDLPFLLLLCQDLIDIVGVDLVLRPSLIMLFLRLLQNVVEIQSLLIEQIVNRLLQFLLR